MRKELNNVLLVELEIELLILITLPPFAFPPLVLRHSRRSKFCGPSNKS